jgi:hypothetical protein
LLKFYKKRTFKNTVSSEPWVKLSLKRARRRKTEDWDWGGGFQKTLQGVRGNQI